ncbi:MAG: hypothetical protein CBE33_07025 [Candidatus Pelagibacter sp. TMED273]|nr:MAG: hypothetical protein CBE33_07025 [Candidatus Pelagibacter sp. TMED273]|tara:strand:- start:3957 stop:5525 length:1569 start_codon:yes stop_codon:yes gene_type:complete
MKLFKKIILYLEKIIFDINEIKFIFFKQVNNNNISLTDKNNILLSAQEEDYYSLCLSTLFKIDKNLPRGKIILYLPLLCFTKLDPKKNFILHLIVFNSKNLFIYLRNLKSKLLYKKNISNSLSLNNFNIFQEYKYINLARDISSKIKNKKDLKNLKINNIKVGREIYDTFIRFSGKTTVDIENFFITEIISKILFIEKKLKPFINKNKIKNFYSRQSAYIQNGYILNLLLSKKINVFLTGSRNEYIYKYNGKHYHYPYNFRKYKKIFKTLKIKKQKILQAKKLLEERLKGRMVKQDLWIDNYNKGNAYNGNEMTISKRNFKCVIFLHCFVDSPFMGGNIIFDDYSDWIIKTLTFLANKNYSNSVIIKPHPDAKPDSIKFENYLKNKFPKFNWLDRNVSNKNIFKKKINIGLTVRGNVIPELAYHGVLPIAAGENISQSFSFVSTPKNQKEYFKSISKNINIDHKKRMKLKKKEIYQLIYMSLIYNLDSTDYLAKRIDLKKINFNNSYSLNTFRKLYIKEIIH